MTITDILNVDGWTVKDGSTASLLSLPTLNNPSSVDWPEYDGVQYDTIGMTFAAKDIIIYYAGFTSPKVSDFESALRSGHSLQGVKAGALMDYNNGDPQPLTLDLRVKGVSKAVDGNLTTLAVTYTMLKPIQGRTADAMSTEDAKHLSGWTLNGIDLGRWGFMAIEGSMGGFHVDSTFKDPLNYTVNGQDGAVWDMDTTPHRAENSISIKTLFRMPIGRAWSTLMGFAETLRADGLKSLADPNGYGRGVIFQSGTASAAYIQDGNVWALYELNFKS